MLRAPRVVDLSTAASYLCDERPLQFILPLVTAYCERVALRDEELDQLFDLIRTRLAMTLTVLYWRLSTRRQGDPYREKTLASHRGAHDFLAALDALGREAVTEQFKKR
jgi:Ser/Thr protein kinase RdoA (MazF antagonist)